MWIFKLFNLDLPKRDFKFKVQGKICLKILFNNYMYIASMFKIIVQSSQDICRFLIAKTVTPGLILGHQEGSKFNKETYLEIILFISTIAMLWGFFKYVHIFIVSYHVNVILNFYLLELSLVHFIFFVFFYTCTFLKSVIFKLIEIELSNSCCSNAYCVHFFYFFLSNNYVNYNQIWNKAL